MREAGKLLMFDSHEELVTATQNAPVVFLSHQVMACPQPSVFPPRRTHNHRRDRCPWQWLAFDEPDPNNDHFLAAIEGIRLLCEHEELDPDALLVWFECAFCRYSIFTLAAAVASAKCAPTCRVHGCCSYSSIPQKNMHTQQLAIDSLAIYASCCKYFIIIAPEAIHADSAIVCNAETYSKRGWCRLEQWARLTVGRTGEAPKTFRPPAQHQVSTYLQQLSTLLRVRVCGRRNVFVREGSDASGPRRPGNGSVVSRQHHGFRGQLYH
eukprot:7381506-Prymnesium_polylepis.1